MNFIINCIFLYLCSMLILTAVCVFSGIDIELLQVTKILVPIILVVMTIVELLSKVPR